MQYGYGINKLVIYTKDWAVNSGYYESSIHSNPTYQVIMIYRTNKTLNISSAEKNLNVKASNYAHKPDL